jgi:hypothetical protein
LFFPRISRSVCQSRVRSSNFHFPHLFFWVNLKFREDRIVDFYPLCIPPCSKSCVYFSVAPPLSMCSPKPCGTLTQLLYPPFSSFSLTPHPFCLVVRVVTKLSLLCLHPVNSRSPHLSIPGRVFPSHYTGTLEVW